MNSGDPEGLLSEEVKMDYNKTAREIIENVGGRDNIRSVMHCVTRVRFVLKDDSIPVDKNVEAIDGVMKVVRSGEQYQVVIGAKVNSVYKAVLEEGNIPDGGVLDIDEGDTKKEDKLVAAAKKQKAKQDPITKFLSLMSGIFAPVLGVLTASGMIKAILVLLNLTGVLATDSGAYVILNAIGDACLYFFPVTIGWSAARKFGMKDIYGIVLGCVLVYPTLISAAGGDAITTLFSGTIFAADAQLSFFGIPVILRDYSTTVIPIILVVWVASLLDKWFEKHIPDLLQAFFVPLLTLLVSSVLGLLVIGPVAMLIQNLLSAGAQALVHLNAGIAGLIIGSLWSILVMFGLHWAIIPFFAIDIATYGYDIINPLIYAGAVASLGSLIGVIIREKNVKEKANIEIPALISTFFGVNEPALYGVYIPRKKIMVTCFLGAGIGGMIAGFSGSKLYSFGASGLFGTPCFINPAGIDGGFIGLMVGAAVAFVFSLVTALIIGAKKDDETEAA